MNKMSVCNPEREAQALGEKSECEALLIMLYRSFYLVGEAVSAVRFQVSGIR
jgi:hypothetical protein